LTRLSNNALHVVAWALCVRLLWAPGPSLAIAMVLVLAMAYARPILPRGITEKELDDIKKTVAALTLTVDSMRLKLGISQAKRGEG